MKSGIHSGGGRAAGLTTALLLLGLVQQVSSVSPLQASFNESDRTGSGEDFRNDWCEREAAVRSGDMQLRDTLEGTKVSMMLEIESFYVYEGTGGRLDGHIPQILDELAKRARFEWRETALLGGLAYEEETYSEYAAYHAQKVDMIANWLTDTPGRRALGLEFPYNWMDMSNIMVTMTEQEEAPFGRTFFSFLRPFEASLWIVVVLGVVYSAVIFWVLESRVNDSFHDRSASEGIEVATFIAAAKLTWSGSFVPASTSGRIFAISWAVVCVCFFVSYTARLTSSLIVSNEHKSTITGPDDANQKVLPVCVWAGTTQETLLKERYPKIPQVAKATELEVFEALKARECVGAVSTMFPWSINEVQREFNADCLLQYVGRPFRTASGGFVTSPDYSGNCAGMFNTAVTLHMAEMEAAGFFQTLQDNRISRERTVMCSQSSAGLEDDKPVALRTMGGLFIMHVIISLLCVALAYYRRPHTLPWAPKQSHQQKAPPEKRASETQRGSGETDLGPATQVQTPRLDGGLPGKTGSMDGSLPHMAARLTDMLEQHKVMMRQHEAMMKHSNIMMQEQSAMWEQQQQLRDELLLAIEREAGEAKLSSPPTPRTIPSALLIHRNSHQPTSPRGFPGAVINRSSHLSSTDDPPHTSAWPAQVVFPVPQMGGAAVGLRATLGTLAYQ